MPKLRLDFGIIVEILYLCAKNNMMEKIIGRKKEIKRLQQYMDSNRSEFIAIYGRRRVGKTFLVKELFGDKLAFRITGMENTNTSGQLTNFCLSLQNFSSSDTKVKSWGEAFRLLEKYLESIASGVKILFFDELPWLDTPGSHFIAEFEHFWNDWASYRDDIKLICCGSATTWMLEEVINSRGGLHNRVTHEIALAPFTLAETEMYFHSRGFAYDRSKIMECYMAIGGVAYYLSLFEQDESVAQNIDRLCFTRYGELRNEFDRLYKALFKKANTYIDIVKALSTKSRGMTRLELIEETKAANNGNFAKKLEKLEECNFIRSYQPFGREKKSTMYQLIDPFSLFYIKFVSGHSDFLSGYWVKMQATEKYRSWCGYAFEMVCLNHLPQVVHALGIDGSINTICSWSYRPPKSLPDDADEDLKHGTQIDLLVDRSDNTVNVCEMKYSISEYVIDKNYFSHLEQRMRIFKKITKTPKSIVPVFITSHGLANNMYARRIPRVVQGDDLFAQV